MRTIGLAVIAVYGAFGFHQLWQLMYNPNAEALFWYFFKNAQVIELFFVFILPFICALALLGLIALHLRKSGFKNRKALAAIAGFVLIEAAALALTWKHYQKDLDLFYIRPAQFCLHVANKHVAVPQGSVVLLHKPKHFGMQMEVDVDLERRLDEPKPLLPNRVGVYLIYKDAVLEGLRNAQGQGYIDEPDLYCKKDKAIACVLKSDREFVRFEFETDKALSAAEIRDAMHRTLEADCGHTH